MVETKVAKIFVAIAAFNEHYIKQTVESLIENKTPQNDVVIQICDFRTTNEFEDFQNKQVIHKKFISSIPTGVGVARNIALDGFQKHEYVLQIDAHMLFGIDWDKNLIERHLLLEAKEGECIISQHLPAFFENKEKTLSNYVGENYLNGPSRLFINNDCHVWSHPWERAESEWYKENSAVSAAFMFSKSKTFSKIPVDPLIFFFGEEHTIYMRMASRGIKSFATDYFDIRHLDKTETFFHDKEKRDWRTFSFSNSDKNVRLFEQFSHKRIGSILRGEITGLWGATNSETAQAVKQKMNITDELINKVFGR